MCGGSGPFNFIMDYVDEGLSRFEQQLVDESVGCSLLVHAHIRTLTRTHTSIHTRTCGERASNGAEQMACLSLHCSSCLLFPHAPAHTHLGTAATAGWRASAATRALIMLRGTMRATPRRFPSRCVRGVLRSRFVCLTDRVLAYLLRLTRAVTNLLRTGRGRCRPQHRIGVQGPHR